MRQAVIVGQARTPFGSFMGAFAQVAAPRLGSAAIQAALAKSGVAPDQVHEVIFGNVLQGGVGRAPARQAALGAKIPTSTPCLTINKVCGSGMKALMLASQSIQLGDSEVVVAGGMESMSLAPYFMQGARSGFRMGNQTLIDGMIHDGLWDPYKNQHMGNCAELCAREYKFSREQQDAYAIDSFKRAQAAASSGKFKNEIVPFTIQGKKGDTVVDTDEGPFKAQFEKIPGLSPVFDKQGTVTAANASTINDGAAAMIVTSDTYASQEGLKPLARIVSQGHFAQEPEWFTTAPAGAMKQALKRAGWSVNDVDLFEVNEAFAVVALAAERDLGIDHGKMNVWGGAIALGHPIGASGARIVMTLIHALRDRGLKRGCAGICIGGGEATSVCVEVL